MPNIDATDPRRLFDLALKGDKAYPLRQKGDTTHAQARAQQVHSGPEGNPRCVATLIHLSGVALLVLYFGMLLGRVAAWNGLVFGMDGLRYRAEKDCPWQQDVHLSADPGEILDALGYPRALPWFDTYDRMWRFVLSSPRAGAWMFMPAATNHENRSRDKQRRKVGDFQDWLVEHHPDHLEPPRPRTTPTEAQAWVRQRFPKIAIDQTLALQQARFEHRKLITRLLGLSAVESVIGPGHSPELQGDLVHEMQALLPPKLDREIAMHDPIRWPDMIRLARAAAAAVAGARGMTTKVESEIPAFIAAPES